MSRTHQLYLDLQQERIRSAALRLELYRVRQDKDALKTQLDAAHAELAALATPVRHAGGLVKSTEQCLVGESGPTTCTTAAQYEALSVRRAGVKL